MTSEDKFPDVTETKIFESLTRDQQLLLYTLDYLTRWMLSDELFFPLSPLKGSGK